MQSFLYGSKTAGRRVAVRETIISAPSGQTIYGNACGIFSYRTIVCKKSVCGSSSVFHRMEHRGHKTSGCSDVLPHTSVCFSGIALVHLRILWNPFFVLLLRDNILNGRFLPRSV